MSIFSRFRFAKKNTASLAKERLQIIVAHERSRRQNTDPDYLPMLQQEIIDVIAKYVKIDRDQVKVELDHDETCSILELNITLPERAEAGVT